jgi:hypothetical protein
MARQSGFTNLPPVNSQGMDRENPPIQAEERRREHTHRPVESYRTPFFVLFFRRNEGGKEQELEYEPLEFPLLDQASPLLERFPEIVYGRFLGFALIISGRPQNSCRFHLIYYLVYVRLFQYPTAA